MPQSIDDLARILLGISELTATEPVPGFPVIEVRTTSGSADVALHGAQVLAWAPKGAEAVLYRSPRAVMEPGTPYRGGIPICWPWFGEHPEHPEFPRHGIARTRFWELTGAESGAANAKLQFRLPQDDETRSFFPHDWELTATIAVGDKLTVTLETRNTGEELFQVTAALHTYLAVGDVTRVQIEGLKLCPYLDCLPDEPTEEFQEKPVKIEGEVDRIYKSMASVLLRDLNQSRSVFIDKSGSRSTVVWNPWKEGCRKTKDLPDRAYQEFVCVETANAGRDRPTVRPGRTHRLEAVIGLRPLG